MKLHRCVKSLTVADGSEFDRAIQSLEVKYLINFLTTVTTFTITEIHEVAKKNEFWFSCLSVPHLNRNCKAKRSCDRTIESMNITSQSFIVIIQCRSKKVLLFFCQITTKQYQYSQHHSLMSQRCMLRTTYPLEGFSVKLEKA